MYEFLAGRPVFLLRSWQGITWAMQAFTDHIDYDLREPDLPGLAAAFTSLHRLRSAGLLRMYRGPRH